MSDAEREMVTITDAKGRFITVARLSGHVYQPLLAGPTAERPRCSCGWGVDTFRRPDAGRRLWFQAHWGRSA